MAESRVIITPRLRILPFTDEHLTSRYVDWLNDPETVRYSEQRHRKHTLESCRQYWKSFSGSPNYFWAVTALDDKIGHIGNMNAYVDVNNFVADIGILIGERALWGKGFGLEAWKAVCKYLLNELGVRKVTAGTLAINEGMLRIMSESGMIPDGRRNRHALVDGTEIDMVYAALFKERMEQ